MKESNRQFNQLSFNEAQVIKLQKSILFLRAIDKNLQDKVENILDLFEFERSKKTIAWKQIEKVIIRVSQKKEF